MLILTPLVTLGIPGLLAVKLLASFSGAGALWLVWLLGRRIAGKDSWLGPVAALALTLNRTFIWWILPDSMEVSTLAILHRRDDVEGLGRLDPRDWEPSYRFTPL